MVRRLILILAMALAIGCDDAPEGGGGDNGSDGPPVGQRPVPETLAEWNLFEDPASQTPADGVHPFEVTAPLFTDHALKLRFLYVPPGETIAYFDDEQKWDFPAGSVLIKTFAYPVDERDAGLGEQLIETRLLVHEESGWQAYVYEWNGAGTQANRVVHGPVKSVSWIDAAGETQTVAAYTIPTVGECRGCHGVAPETNTIGPSTAMLDRDNDFGSGAENQIDYLHARGLFDSTPLPNDQRLQFPDPFDGSADATDRARAYLHTNCSHCHSADGLESGKNLFVEWSRTDPDTGDPADWKVCLDATSAGNASCLATTDHVIVPGDPDASLLLCRMEIEHPEPGPMPPLGRSVLHGAGANLIADWIFNMNAPGCGS